MESNIFSVYVFVNVLATSPFIFSIAVPPICDDKKFKLSFGIYSKFNGFGSSFNNVVALLEKSSGIRTNM